MGYLHFEGTSLYKDLKFALVIFTLILVESRHVIINMKSPIFIILYHMFNLDRVS